MRIPRSRRAPAPTVENAKNVRLRDVEVAWEKPCANSWQNTLTVRNVQNLRLEGLAAEAPPNGSTCPPVLLENVTQK